MRIKIASGSALGITASSQKYPMRGKQTDRQKERKKDKEDKKERKQARKQPNQPINQGTEYAPVQGYPGPYSEKTPGERGKSQERHAENRGEYFIWLMKGLHNV